MRGGEDDGVDGVEGGLRGRPVALATLRVVLRPDRSPFVNDRHGRQLGRDLRLHARVASAVERSDVVDEDDVGSLLVEEEPGEAARAPALGLHEDRERSIASRRDVGGCAAAAGSGRR